MYAIWKLYYDWRSVNAVATIGQETWKQTAESNGSVVV